MSDVHAPQLIEVASEMQSPETALISLTKNEDEFRRVMTEVSALAVYHTQR